MAEATTDQEFPVITNQCSNDIVSTVFPTDFKALDKMQFSYTAFQFQGVAAESSQIILGCELKICDFLDYSTGTSICNTEIIWLLKSTDFGCCNDGDYWIESCTPGQYFDEEIGE